MVPGAWVCGVRRMRGTGTNKFLRRLARPMDRGQYGKFVLLSLFCTMAAVSTSNDKVPMWHWLMLILAGFYALIWPIETTQRLSNIGWSRWWALAFAVPWMFLIGVANWGGKLWPLAALFLALLAQLPLLLIKGGVLGRASLGSHASAEPRA